MDLLILGGTGQLGRHIVSAALDSGHSVTCLARGTNPAPGGAQLVRADRDLPHPYREVEGTRWDAVVELASAPGRVREATFIPVQSPSEGQLRWELSQAN